MKQLILRFFTKRLPIAAAFALVTSLLIYGRENISGMDIAFISLMIMMNMTLGWLYGAADSMGSLLESLKEKRDGKVD